MDTTVGTPLYSPYVLLLVVLAVVGASLSLRAVRHRAEPGSGPFAAMMATQTVWLLSYAVALVTFDPALRESLEVIEWIAGALVPVWWLAFALEYTGRGQWVTKRTVLAAAALPVATGAVIATNDVHGLIWSNYRIVEGVPIATVGYDYGPWFYLQIAYSYGQMIGGFALLAGLLVRYDTLYTDQTVAMGLAVLLPWAGNTLWVLGLVPVEGLDLTQYAFAVSGFLLGHALFRYDLLAVVPATSQIGEKTVVHDLDSGVVMLGRAGTVQWLNDAAAGTFGVAADEAAGRPVEALLGQSIDLDAEEVTVDLDTEGGHRTYRISVSSISDQHGAPVGHALVLTDVTDQRLRRQRLEVLNRVLRHNLRNEMNVIQLTAEHIADEGGEHARQAERIVDQADEMVDLAAQVHRTERVVGGDVDANRTADVTDLVERIADGGREQAPSADVSVDVPERLSVETDPALLEEVLATLVENAVEHSSTNPGSHARQDAVEHGSTSSQQAENAVEHGSTSSQQAENAVEHGSTSTGSQAHEEDDSNADEVPTVEIHAEAVDGWLVVQVADDGPGLPDHEVATITAGRETELRHGSGLGLWLARWGTTRLGGRISFGESGLGGAQVTVRIPGAGTGSPE